VTPREVISSAGGRRQYSKEVYRIVETQAGSAADFLVDDLEEQSVLESIIDDFKPPAAIVSSEYHYLISTPFRYPPLKHGSRFGSRAQSSFYYASEEIQTCLTESAYYRFAFFEGMSEPYPHKVRSNHQLFSVATMTANGLDLTRVSEKLVSDALQSKTDYQLAQNLGAAARAEGYELIRFHSARLQAGINVAIDNVDVIISTTPTNITAVKCETFSVDGIISMSLPKSFPLTFRRAQFLVNGHFPYPPK
tara:strand:- start:1052 stop:1801 length:750 start_codon:yes stop_codon:yes gene_type:complete